MTSSIQQKVSFGFLLAVLLFALPMTARADFIYQTINKILSPGPYSRADGNNLGWYWTPATNVDLTGIETKLTTGFANINNNFTFTTAVYTDRPGNGGTLLDSLTWNGATYLSDGWLAGSCSSPLSLTGRATYFLGFTGWSAALD